MARALVGDESLARRAVTLGMIDLYRNPDSEPVEGSREALRTAARSVYLRCQEMSEGDRLPRSRSGPPVMAELREMALLQRATLALCVFGGHSYRDAAALLGTSHAAVARLLISGLRELLPLTSARTGAGPSEPRHAMETIHLAHALLERATQILMTNLGLEENYAVERLCRDASATGSTVVEAAARVIAEVDSGTDSAVGRLHGIHPENGS